MTYPTFGSPTIPHFSDVPNLPRREGVASASFLCLGGILLPLAINNSRTHPRTLPPVLVLPSVLPAMMLAPLGDLAQQVYTHMRQTILAKAFFAFFFKLLAFATPAKGTQTHATRGRHVIHNGARDTKC